MALVIWTEPAYKDLDHIREYISKDSQYYASKLIKKIFEITGKLSSYPDIGKPVVELMPSDYKEILFKNTELYIAPNLIKFILFQFTILPGYYITTLRLKISSHDA